MKPASLARPDEKMVWAAIIYILALTLFRLVYGAHLPLIPDEAYYWEWSRHLDWCYRDKGPGVAWAIALGTAIGDHSVLGVRWVGILLGAGTAWQLFTLARRLFDASVGLAALVIASVIPILAIGSVIMTIDSLSVFFWAWSINLTWTATQSNRKRDWALLGFAIGCGFLAKFTNILQLGSVFLYLLSTPACRRYIVSAGTALMLAVFAVCTTPILYWNIIHDWPNARALSSRSSIDKGFQIHPQETLKFFEGQFAAISPLLYAGMLVAIVALCLKRVKEDRIRFLLCDFFPIYACFTFFSMNAAGQPNWTAPALMAGIVLMVVFWRELIARSRGWRIAACLAFVLALAETVILHDTSWLIQNPRKDPLQRAKGWSDLAARTGKLRIENGAGFVIGNHYSVASILAFYLPGQPTTFTPTSPTVDNQYCLWPPYQVNDQTTALFVTNDETPESVPWMLREQFKHVKFLTRFWTQENGRDVRQFQVYLCTNQDLRS